ncbi:hypothetical protein SLOPH_2311 [Spraguea lophii 42_110]|uniref:Transmembrane amino acid transporter protein n=1 Tax=Spraguea lophii (strain 42_110) TaxID=1358809 RepID=S7XQ74_SPRLO|nr:hypothetical protein SLOPH_2311 [Spraguea lophii 42_110]
MIFLEKIPMDYYNGIHPIITIFNNMIVCGILFMPSLFNIYGIIPTASFVLVIAFCNILGYNLLFLLIKQHMGVHSIPTLADRIYYPTDYITNFILYAQYMSTVFIYSGIAFKQMKIVMIYFNMPSPGTVAFIIMMSVGCLIFWYNGIIDIIYIPISITCAILLSMILSFFLSDNKYDVPLYSNYPSVICDTGVFIFAFCCQNKIMILEENTTFSHSSFKKITMLVVLFVSLLNIVFGYINSKFFQYFYNESVHTWINLIPKSHIGIIIRILLFFSLLFYICDQMNLAMNIFSWCFSTFIPLSSIALFGLKSYQMLVILLLPLMGFIFELQSYINGIGFITSAYLSLFVPSFYYIMADKRVQKPIYSICAYFLLCMFFVSGIIGILVFIF